VFENSFLEPPPLTTTVRIMLTIWFVILVPWFPFFTLMGTGMAFEGGYTFSASFFVFIAWTYPASVGVAYFFRSRRPKLIWLPFLPLIPALASLLSN
jgi:hypothetical protein